MFLFRTKPIASLQHADRAGGLKRVLGPANLVALGIGAIIGTGIFVLTGQAAAAHAGPAIVISMVLAGVVQRPVCCVLALPVSDPASHPAPTARRPVRIGSTKSSLTGSD